ncbi:phosphomannomutase [Shewanella sp. CAL98-MNA-CIBAN-0140]|uniref:phosphomannomutase n=1 Tax=unclassified Shewanella TaxID=196818 RepID=UPI003328844E
MLDSRNIIAISNIGFGTSGARGLVSDFTSNVCGAFTVSFIHVMKASFSFSMIAIAIDNRPSSLAMAQACATAAAQCDVDVVFYGVVPTPALASCAMAQGIPCIMVTGSHIPFDRNGLKFYRPDGEINKSDEIAIINGEFTYEPIQQLQKLSVDDTASNDYITRYSSLFSRPWLSGKRIGIYQHSSAGRDLYPRLFQQLGAEIILIGRSDTFVAIDTEAVSEADCQKAIEWTQRYQLDALFSTDGDGDRPMLADENGHWLRGDILGLLCAKALNIEALAVPVSCNTAIEQSGFFQFVIRTQIGSPYVIAAFEELNPFYKCVAGFEANGGFLLGSTIEVDGNTLSALPTRDAILPVLMVLYHAISSSRSVAALVTDLPQRYTHSDRLTEFATERSKKIIAIGQENSQVLLGQLGLLGDELSSVNVIDGLRFIFVNGNIIHLRPSGNAPEFRCYAESVSIIEAKKLVNKVLTKLSIINFYS